MMQLFSMNPNPQQHLDMDFVCGFLGLLHLEIVQERLEREFNQNLVTTVPNVRYKIIKTNGETIYIDSPAELPEQVKIKEIRNLLFVLKL